MNCTHFQYSCLENPMDRGSCQATVHKATKVDTEHTCWQGRTQNPSGQASTYGNRELPEIQAGFRKGRGTRSQTANILQITEKAWKVQKSIYFCFIDYAKAYDCVAAAAKSPQLCPTLCDPIEGSPPGSPVPGILQARTLEWAAISFSNA